MTGREDKLGLGAAAPWPVFECLISEEWRDPGHLTEILVSKEPPFGGVVCCVFLVDLGCLGPKEGFVTQFRTKAEYERRFRSLMTSRGPMVPVEFSPCREGPPGVHGVLARAWFRGPSGRSACLECLGESGRRRQVPGAGPPGGR